MEHSTYLLSVLFGIYQEFARSNIHLVGWKHVSSELLIIEEDMDSDKWQAAIESAIAMMDDSLNAEDDDIERNYRPISHTLCKVR